MVKRQKPLSQAIGSIMQDPEQVELERQFKEQLSLAEEQDKNQPQKTAADFINDARAQVNELLSITRDMRASLSTVGEFAPFFDVGFLTREGVTDIAKIDQNYMLTIGRQLVSDYRKFDAEAVAINNRIGGLKTRLDSVVNPDNPQTLDELSDIVHAATIIQSDYVAWGEQFQRIVLSAMTDIVNHLNPLRPAERRIIL